ncbi:hypothetical protein ATANTOWER_022326 [Ataeniobius toweri]|uniref:Uncharacterized protein n=1 Tax=Ataeniobius toweri TaxID=208326 RepID=A0ABU7A8S6_9TELE|nr:hypothetical protein [Ataeniobius toweri]
MALQRENAVKLELSKAEERMEKAETKLKDLKADELKKAFIPKAGANPHLSDPNGSVGSQMVSSGVLPNPIAVNNHQDDRVPDSAWASGPIGWKEQSSNLICTLLPADSVSTPKGQERCTWSSSDSTHHHRNPVNLFTCLRTDG